MSDLRTYRHSVQTFWWLKKRSYFIFVMRELSSIFIAYFVVFLLVFITAVGRGEDAYNDFLDGVSHPIVVALERDRPRLPGAPHDHLVQSDAEGDGCPARRPSGPCFLDHRLAVRRARGGLRLHLLAGDGMTKLRVTPFVWLMFSGGGVMAAIFLPSLAFLFALAYPLGWLDAPDHDHLEAVIGNPLTILVLFGLFVMMLVHSAHRFRYTLYDGLQIQSKKGTAVVCYGSAAIISLVALRVLL